MMLSFKDVAFLNGLPCVATLMLVRQMGYALTPVCQVRVLHSTPQVSQSLVNILQYNPNLNLADSDTPW